MVSAVSTDESHLNINKGRKVAIDWLFGVILAVCHLCPDIPLVGHLTYPQLAEVYGPVTSWTTNGSEHTKVDTPMQTMNVLRYCLEACVFS